MRDCVILRADIASLAKSIWLREEVVVWKSAFLIGRQQRVV